MAALTAERERRQAKADDVMALFKSKPGVWIDWTELAKVGGGAAWRTRVSECRQIVKADRGQIENRQSRTVTQGPHGLKVSGPVVSEYRYLPYEPLGRDASIPVPDHWPAFDAPIQEVWSLKP